MKMVTIIGAGPAGNYLAWKLAEKGYPVEIYEEHTVVGKPIQCTGIVTKTLRDLVPIDPSFFVNQLSSVQVVAPHNDTFTVPLEDFVICRTSFDQFLLKKAISAGAKVYKGHKYIRFEKGKVFVEKKSEKGKKKIIEIKTDILVGADGPNSLVSKLLNKDVKRINYFGAQATVKGKFDPGRYDVYLGDICPEFFGWVVPENKKYARIGLAVKKDTAKHFKKFLAHLGHSESDITDYQGGLIPVYVPQLKIEGSVDDVTVYLLGDSATQIKSTTGGGIIPAISSANVLIDCIVSGKSYAPSMKKSKVYKQVWMHLVIRRVLDLFSDKDYDRLIGILKKESIVKVLAEVDRDNPVTLLSLLLRRNPLLPVRLFFLFCKKKFFVGAWKFWKDVK
jgi:digeranylgeranylglycerophospholipid reductase